MHSPERVSYHPEVKSVVAVKFTLSMEYLRDGNAAFPQLTPQAVWNGLGVFESMAKLPQLVLYIEITPFEETT